MRHWLCELIDTEGYYAGSVIVDAPNLLRAHAIARERVAALGGSLTQRFAIARLTAGEAAAARAKNEGGKA